MRDTMWVAMMLTAAVAAGCGTRPSARPPVFGPDEPQPTTQAAPAEVPVDPATIPTTTVADTQPSTRPAPSTNQTDENPDAGATTAPATNPTTAVAATAPATAPMESPRQILAGVMNATFRGDAEGVRRRLLVEGDESQRLADAMADVARAAGQVREAAAAKFGAEEARKLDVDVVPPVVIASAVEHIDNDRATVKLQGQNGNGITFQKVDGTWKMSLPELIAQQKQGRSIDQLINETRSPVGRFEDLARRVNEGKFENVEQVMAELAQTFFGAQQGK